jgi:hypothetical protein
MIDFIQDLLTGIGMFFILAVAAAFIFWQVQKRKR